MLTNRGLERYRRQIALFGEDAREPLASARVIILVQNPDLRVVATHATVGDENAAGVATLPVERQEDCSACGKGRC